MNPRKRRKSQTFVVTIHWSIDPRTAPSIKITSVFWPLIIRWRTWLFRMRKKNKRMKLPRSLHELELSSHMSRRNRTLDLDSGHQGLKIPYLPEVGSVTSPRWQRIRFRREPRKARRRMFYHPRSLQRVHFLPRQCSSKFNTRSAPDGGIFSDDTGFIFELSMQQMAIVP